MLRILRPDLLCGLVGFALGAAALLITHPDNAKPPLIPSGHTDVLQQAETASASVRAG